MTATQGAEKTKWVSAGLPALIGGVVGGLIWVGFLHIPEIGKIISQIDAGDWLQAFAAFAAVVATIRATLWLEDRKRGQQRTDEQRLLRESLGMFQTVLQTIRAPLSPDLTLGQRTTLTAGHYELIFQQRKVLSYARQDFRIQHYNLWNALNAIEHDFALAADKLTHEENIVRNPRIVSEPVLAISRREIEAFAAEIEAPVNAAVVALKEAEKAGRV